MEKNQVTSPCAHSISSVQEDGWSWGHISLICYGNSHSQNQALIAKWISTVSFCANSLKINHLVHWWLEVLSEYGIWAICTVGCIVILPPTPQIPGCGGNNHLPATRVIALSARSRGLAPSSMGSRWSRCTRELEDVCWASCRQMQALPSSNREAHRDVSCTSLVTPEAAQRVSLSCCPASSHFSVVMTESCFIASVPSSVWDFLARQSTWTAHGKSKMGQLQQAKSKQTKGMHIKASNSQSRSF